MKSYDTLDLLGNKVTGVATPTNDTDGANKAYVDAAGGGGVPPTVWDANSIVKADSDDLPVALTVGPSTLVGRAATGGIAALTPAQVKIVLNINIDDLTGYGDLAKLNQVGAAEIVPGTVSDYHIHPEAAIALSKLADDPLARANHTGTQLAATISDFDTQTQTSRLDQMATPTAPVNAGTQKITNLGTPTVGTDAVTMAYVDSKPAAVINTDGNPGHTIYVGATDPDIAYDLLPGDVWMDVS